MSLPDRQQHDKLERMRANILLGEGAVFQVEVFGDTACPWCYVSKVNLDRSFKGFPSATFKVRWWPYLLDAEVCEAGETIRAYMERRYGRYVDLNNPKHPLNEACRAAKINLHPDRRMVNTLRSQALIRHAGAQNGHEKQYQMAGAIMHAYFDTAADINDPAVLRKLAEELAVPGAAALLNCDAGSGGGGSSGSDGGEERGRLDESARQSVLRLSARAEKDPTIETSPFFVISREGFPGTFHFRGAQSERNFRRAFRSLLQDREGTLSLVAETRRRMDALTWCATCRKPERPNPAWGGGFESVSSVARRTAAASSAAAAAAAASASAAAPSEQLTRAEAVEVENAAAAALELKTGARGRLHSEAGSGSGKDKRSPPGFGESGQEAAMAAGAASVRDSRAVNPDRGLWGGACPRCAKDGPRGAGSGGGGGGSEVADASGAAAAPCENPPSSSSGSSSGGGSSGGGGSSSDAGSSTTAGESRDDERRCSGSSCSSADRCCSRATSAEAAAAVAAVAAAAEEGHRGAKRTLESLIESESGAAELEAASSGAGARPRKKCALMSSVWDAVSSGLSEAAATAAAERTAAAAALLAGGGGGSSSGSAGRSGDGRQKLLGLSMLLSS